MSDYISVWPCTCQVSIIGSYVFLAGVGGVNEPVKLRKVDGTTYEAAYHPRTEGRHVVMVTFAGQEIPRSPFDVNVGPYKQTKIRAYGPGLAGGVVGYPALFTVETNGETGALGMQCLYSSSFIPSFDQLL